MQTYNDVQSLISQDADAQHYYNGLPGYIQEMVSARESLNSLDMLKRYAENLLIGD